MKFTKDHEWVSLDGDIATVGISKHAADALGDVVFVSLPQVGEEVALDDACAEVESTKSVSDVYAPVSGVVTAVNEQLASTPETINADPYGDGWLFELELAEPGEVDDLLDADAYAQTIGE